ncbi:hypothetical protein GCM10022260_23320 [Gaetbulibacter aestuarii]
MEEKFTTEKRNVQNTYLKYILAGGAIVISVVILVVLIDSAKENIKNRKSKEEKV